MQDTTKKTTKDGIDPDLIQETDGGDDYDLAEQYLENGYTIQETADELGIDDMDLLEEYGDEYDYE